MEGHTVKTAQLMAASALISVFLSATFCAAGPFDKEFTLKSIMGTCTVTLPDGKISAAEEGKAYPYGATVATGRKSSAVLELSSGNEVRVLANSTLKADQKAEDASDKTIRLREGRIQVKLQEDFHKANKFTVETPTAVCGAIGCEFTAVAAPATCSFEVQEGQVLVSGAGPYAQWATELDSGDKISVSTVGKTITTVSNNGGKFQLKYKGAGGQEHPIDLPTGTKVDLTIQLGKNEQGKPVVKLVIAITNPDGTKQQPIETIVQLPANTVLPETPPGTPPPPTLLEANTTGTTPTPVGEAGP